MLRLRRRLKSTFSPFLPFVAVVVDNPKLTFSLLTKNRITNISLPILTKPKPKAKAEPKPTPEAPKEEATPAPEAEMPDADAATVEEIVEDAGEEKPMAVDEDLD